MLGLACPGPNDQTLVLVHRVPACAWTEQGLGGPACVIMSKHCSPRHCQGSDLHFLLCLAARETGRYLHLPPVRAHGREAHCLHPGSQEPEEDGCGGPLRWVLLRGSLSPPHWGLSASSVGEDSGAICLAELGKAPQCLLMPWRQPKVWLGGEGRQAWDVSLSLGKDTLNLVPLVQAGPGCCRTWVVKGLLCHLLLVLLLLDLGAGDLSRQHVLCSKCLPIPLLGLSSVSRGPQLSPDML